MVNIKGKQYIIHNQLALSNEQTFVIVSYNLSKYNCSSNGNFIIYHTFNFATEWLHNKNVMPYYRENEHILRLPSSASIPSLNVIISNSTDVYTESKIPAISLQQLDNVIGDIKQDKIYLSISD